MQLKRTPELNIFTAAFFVICALSSVTYFLFPISVGTKIYLGYQVDSVLNFTELTAKYGYLTEEHSVTTEDGYILQLFRIVKAKNCHGRKKKPPVILMHELIQSSDSWLDAGPDDGLGYLIADACYDLWVGNVRGNYYSRRHITMDPRDPQFWQFSVDEIGFYDIPATIGYVLEHTETKKVNYIGFSQGALTFFIMCSERPEYCDKVNVLIGLAPAAIVKNSKSTAFKGIVTLVTKLEGILSKFGSLELFSKGSLTQEFLAFFNLFCDFTGTMSSSIMAFIDSDHPGSVTSETMRTLAGHIPAGTSAHNLAWYSQALSGKFEKFDYGKTVNLDLYGSESPPKYNLSAVTVPAVIFYGKNDGLMDIKDIKWLVERLPNVLKSEAVPNPLWTHFDFNYSQYISELIFERIDEYLNKYSYV